MLTNRPDAVAVLIAWQKADVTYKIYSKALPKNDSKAWQEAWNNRSFFSLKSYAGSEIFMVSFPGLPKPPDYCLTYYTSFVKKKSGLE